MSRYRVKEITDGFLGKTLHSMSIIRHSSPFERRGGNTSKCHPITFQTCSIGERSGVNDGWGRSVHLTISLAEAYSMRSSPIQHSSIVLLEKDTRNSPKRKKAQVSVQASFSLLACDSKITRCILKKAQVSVQASFSLLACDSKLRGVSSRKPKCLFRHRSHYLPVIQNYAVYPQESPSVCSGIVLITCL
ncbi:hypothetical protein TNCV_2168331 [Trichonephila clavipes]|nr:hypothetical protein TNCV_2168331 [Trichonephila clavipes]